MFTIRINWPNSKTPSYSVYSADKYSVGWDADNGAMYIVLERNNGTEATTVMLGGARVYVMNDRGSTVDTIIS